MLTTFLRSSIVEEDQGYILIKALIKLLQENLKPSDRVQKIHNSNIYREFKSYKDSNKTCHFKEQANGEQTVSIQSFFRFVFNHSHDWEICETLAD